MKEGAWIEAATGHHHWIDEHADWIRRKDNAHRAGLPNTAVERLATMPRNDLSGSEREAILLVAMEAGLIRFRGHGSFITFESILPLQATARAVAPFMAQICGPLTGVRINQLPDGPSIGLAYRDLLQAVQVGDI